MLIFRLKHRSPDIDTLLPLIETRLRALRYADYVFGIVHLRRGSSSNNQGVLENIHVEIELEQWNDDLNQQLRSLKHQPSIVRTHSSIVSSTSTLLSLGSCPISTQIGSVSKHVR